MSETHTRSIRLQQAEVSRITKAAAKAGVSLNAYIVRAAMMRAEGELGDGMSPARWEEIARQVAEELAKRKRR